MSAKVDAVEILESALAELQEMAISDYDEDNNREFARAIAAIAELIAADIEYDAAKEDYDTAWMDGEEQFTISSDRMANAIDRRAAALAAVTGEGQG